MSAPLPPYIKDGAAIYQRSFAIIRAEANLSRFPPIMERVAVRMIHACGMPDIAGDILFSPQAAEYGRAALRAGAPILCDSRMVANGITKARLPAQNRIISMLDTPGLAEAAARGLTRSAAALDYWRGEMQGALIAIGNAPTALFRLLEMLAEVNPPQPALILGLPVGFVGAAESKQALTEHHGNAPYISLRGRRGGSAMTVAAINALAQDKE